MNRPHWKRPEPKDYWDAQIAKQQNAALRKLAVCWYGNQCTKCAASENLNVHHRHYRTFGYETKKDVLLLCRPCHGNLHERYLQGILTPDDAWLCDPLWQWCPHCHKLMILRVPKYEGEFTPFWGCRDFPKCKGSAPAEPSYYEPEAQTVFMASRVRTLYEFLMQIADAETIDAAKEIANKALEG